MVDPHTHAFADIRNRILLEHEHSHPSPTWTSSGPSPTLSSSGTLAPLVVHHVELVDESDQVVAALVNRAHQRHQGYVVALKTGELRVVKRLF